MLWVINAANKVLYPVRYRQGININGTSPSVIVFLSCLVPAASTCLRRK
jgi:hypothetical protein